MGESELPEYYLWADAARRVGAALGVSRFTEGTTPLSLPHQGQLPAAAISFNLVDGISLSDAMRAIQAAEVNMGMPASITGKFAGTAQAFQDSLSSQPVLILTALLAVYIVLGMLYESLVHPLTIISTCRRRDWGH